MAEIKLLQIDLRLDSSSFFPSQPELHIPSGTNFTYQINKNFEGFGYDINPSLVDKTFVSADTTQVDNIFTLNGGIAKDLIGSFDDEVLTIEPFNYREEDVNLIAVGGKFSEYTKNGVTTACNLFIILNADGTVFNSVDYSDFINSGVSVDIIKYHSINDSLLIGGQFEGVDIYDLNNIFELDLLNEAVSASMINFATEGSVNGKVTAIDVIQSNGVIAFGGKFTRAINVVARRLFMVNSEFELQRNKLFDKFRNTINIQNLGNGDDINEIFIKQQGDLQILVCGNFKSDIRDNLIAFNVLGNQIDGFKSLDANTKNISKIDNNYYISGNFEEYNGIDVNKIIRVNLDGVIDPTFIFDYDIDAITEAVVAENNTIYINFVSQTLSYDFGRLNVNTGLLDKRLNINNSVKAFAYLEDGNSSSTNDLLIGGDIIEYNDLTTDLNPNEVLLVNSSVSITRDNLFNNLVEQNSIDTDLGFKYIKIGNDTVRVFKIIENENDIYFINQIKDIPNKLSITIASNDAGLEGRLINIPIRKDFFIKSPAASNWSNASFRYDVYEQGFFSMQLNEDSNQIDKQKISDVQTNQFLNLSPLIDISDLESNISYYNNLGYGKASPILNSANVGKFISFSSNISINDNVLEEKNDIGFILDGYNDFESILLKGKKRTFKAKDKITIPFITSRVSKVIVRDGLLDVTLLNTNFENIDPNNSDIYISYVCIDYDLYFNKDKTVVDFYDNNGLFDTVTLFKANTSALFNSFKVIFKNSFGVLETTYMGGRSIDSVSTDSSKYKRDVKDINGNIQEPLKHRNKTYNKVGEREWECNTGLVDAYMNDCYEDLFMSEEVWLEYEGELKAVSLEESNFNKEDNLQTDMINYSFRFKEDIKINE